MAAHNDLGKKGERLALAWLMQRGYAPMYTNWRHSHYEVDLIASRETVLHFIEIKARRTMKFGYPEESVDEKKIQNLMNAAEEFLYQHPEWKRIQYDILSIFIKTGNEVEYFFIEDVYL